MSIGQTKTKRLLVPLLFTALLAVTASALCIALSMACDSAYGDTQANDSNKTTASPTLMVGSVDESGLHTASTATFNIGNGSCTCNDPGTEYTIIGSSTSNVVTINGGSESNPIYVTLKNVRIEQGSMEDETAPVTVAGGYAIIRLEGTNVLKGGYEDVSLKHDNGLAGLCVQSGAACVITSASGDKSTDGSLTATGGHDKYGGAGIGSNYNKPTGSIIIRGGTINASGAHCAAGIGSGRDGICNTVSIEGGDVTATGGEYAAGIGGGDAVGSGDGGTTNDLQIHDGIVRAYGGNDGGAGIGGSEGGGTEKITITGGNITALGCGQNGSAGSAAGIGSGDGQMCTTIDINQVSNNLTINAKGYGEGAGIGGANCQSGTINITLKGGTITATGGPEAAGIGSGDDESGAIKIKGNGTINAHAGSKSAAIGAGDQGNSGPININGNSSLLNINAYAPEPKNPGENFTSYAAIIGAGDGSASDITINNANINLYAPSGTLLGAGIGTGSSNDLSISDGGIGNITISNATIRFSIPYKMYGAGIGAGYGSNIKNITLNNVDYNGPTIGSSCSDRFGTNENSVRSISIANSTIVAIARGDDSHNHAGIGTGPYGTIDSITITNSTVEAKGVNGGAGIGSGGIFVNPGQALHSITSDDGKCGSVTITGSGTVKSTGSGGGAGIGSGALTSVTGNISISRGATVNAVGGKDGAGGGAGIGSGKLCSCAGVSIDGASVTAVGGPGAAGIGSAGVVDTTVVGGAIETAWNTICGNISITGSSSVTATGGAGAAGIGLGQGAQMESNSWIVVSDSSVTAEGGTRGAGIGAGCESGLGRGGEARRIKIDGTSKVNANGGAGAAGIGGGYEGGFEQCSIGLSENNPANAYVIAHGGVGAAGIGAGASSRHSTDKGTLDNAHDAKSISISGGFIAAYGGNGLEGSVEGRSGAGAGIGGGSYQGDLEGCTISGGVVVAHKGAKASGAPSGGVDAQDIGHGGSREGGGDGSDDIRLTGGTVIGNVSENDTVMVCGGSVTHSFTPGKAVDAHYDNIPVYQNALTIDTSKLGPAFVFEGQSFYLLASVGTSAEYFNGDSVFAVVEDGLPANRARVYLYLPAGEKDATTVTCKPADVLLSYYGTTNAIQRPNYSNNTNVLKMGAPIAVVPKRRSDPLVEGQPYTVRVGDLSGALGDTDTACYITPATNATIKGYTSAGGELVSDVSNVPIYTYYDSVRTYTDVTVIPGAAGSKMRITAKLNGTSAASDIYWGDGVAFYEAVIGEAPLYVEITNEANLTKYYDGNPVVDPTVDTNGTVYDTKYSGYSIEEDGSYRSYGPTTVKPSAIGNYSVTVWAERNGKHATDTASFKILESPDVQVKIVEDPTKFYDGKPVTDPKVVATKDATVTYAYSSGDRPIEPGVYLVKATAKIGIKQASDLRLFLIRKVLVELSVNADDKVYDGAPAKVTTTAKDMEGKAIEQATELSYFERLDDGSFGRELGSAPVNPGKYYVKAVTSGDDHYRTAEAADAFEIFEKPAPFLFVDVPKAEIYDNDVVEDPFVWSFSNADAIVRYYDKDGNLLSDAPKDAGRYSLEVSVPETDRYQAASSGRIQFAILRRPAVLSISAYGNRSTGGATVAVKLIGALEDVVGKFVSIDISYSPPDPSDDQGLEGQSENGARLATQAATTILTEIKNVDGSYVATHEFSGVDFGEYKVTARFDDDYNYIVQDVTEYFDKNMGAYLVTAKNKTVTYGDAPFTIQAEVHDNHGSVVENPTLTYSQFTSNAYPAVTDDAAVLGNNGMVSVCNAGISVVRVDVAGDATHKGSTDYAVITVERAQLPLTVTAKDKVADGEPTNVTYSAPDSYTGTVELAYFREVDGSRIKLDTAPVESGTYVVVAYAKGDRNYNAAVSETTFQIRDASDPVDPDNPVNPDNPDKPDTPDNPDKPSTKPTSGNNGGSSTSKATRTGDSVVVWPLLATAVLGFAVSVFALRRICANRQQDGNRTYTWRT